MKLYSSDWTQLLIVVLYAVAAFWILSRRNDSAPWLDIAVLLIFCMLWRNVRYLLLSTVITLITAVPIWWIFDARYTLSGQEMLGWYPLVIIHFLIFVLLPEVIIVLGRNSVIRYFQSRRT